MRVSEHFQLGSTQPELDFVDVDIVKDTRLFVDPRALLAIESEWADEAVHLVQNFFQEVLDAVRTGDHRRGQRLLGYLREPNETHLGLSRGRSRGYGLGTESSLDVYEALASSQAAHSGLLEDLEDTILVIPRIDRDIVSDITTNIIRGPLIGFTQEACEYYGMPTHSVDSGPMWNPQRKVWQNGYVQLPVPRGHKLLLIPKVIVRQRMHYDGQEYFNHYVLTFLQDVELSAGSSIVEVLKSGRRRVTKKTLKAKYGVGKEVAARITEQYPEILDQYRHAKRHEIDGPLTHAQLADAAGFEEPDFDSLLARVRSIRPGREEATKYHHAVEALLSAVFYPSLTQPRREFPIHHGRKRIDIRYVNSARSGFFDWLSRHYPSGYIWVECKNYEREVGNPEVDQISGRFAPQRGRVGFLVYRGYVDKDQVWQRCIDTACDDRGWIIPLDDEDLSALVEERKQSSLEGRFDSFRTAFNRLVM